MKQPVFAPVLAGGGVIGGLAGILVSGYALADCFRYERGRGACTQVVEEHVLPLVTGIAALSGTVGGLFTYNRKLERPEAPPAPLPVKEKIEPGLSKAELDLEWRLRRSFERAIEAGEIPRVNAPAQPPPPSPEKAKDLRRETYAGEASAQVPVGEQPVDAQDELEEEVLALRAEGLSLQKIADQVDTTVYRVRTILEESTEP